MAKTPTSTPEQLPKRSTGALSGKAALVTGAASGFGRAVTEKLIAEGAQVLATDIVEQHGREAAEAAGAEFHRLDVTDLDANRQAIELAESKFGGLDLVHLNAGIASGFGLGEEFDLDSYRLAMAVNLDGVVFGAHAALAALQRRGGGSIVATASLAGLSSVPFDPIYAANKHAVVGLTRSLGPIFAQDGVHFNAVCPGFAETAIIDPIRKVLSEDGVPVMTADEVAEVVLDLFAADLDGECVVVQAGVPPYLQRFRGIPAPRESSVSGKPSQEGQQ